MPGFTGGHSEQSDKRGCERLKVGMNSKSTLELNFTKYLHTQDWVNKNDKEKQCSDICELWESINKCVEEDPQILVFTNDFENSADSEWSYNGCRGSDIQAHIVKNLTNPGNNNDGKIKFVPTVIKVVFAKCDQLDGCFNSVNDVESQVNWGDDSRNLHRLIIPRES